MYVLLPDDAGIFDRQCQTQHYKICVCSIEAVGVILMKLLSIASHELHDLVFALSGGV